MQIIQKSIIYLGLSSAIMLSSCGEKVEEVKAPYKLVEEVKQSKESVNIPYKRFEFDNGLTLIVHEDHSDPIVHVDVTYHVGSAREEIGRSGFAHFFEHMMFQGSENVADEQHFKIISEAGGNLNGTTNMDRTNYFETMPANQLETALWLEADRMGFLLNAVTQKKFEVQRGTVKNERGQNYDNRPYGLVWEKVGQAIYEYGHPYSWPTIGYIEDLNRVDVEDLKKFFLRWYGPNNAVLTVAGDVNTDNVAELVEKYFANIPKGPEVNPMAKTREPLDTTRYISYEDKKIRFPMITVAFPSVPRHHKDEAPLDVLSNILGGEKNSVFYEKFIKSNKAVQASAFNFCQELGGNLMFQILPYPIDDNSEFSSLADVEKMVHDAFAEFETRGVKDEDLERYKSTTEAYMIKSLASVSGKASSLASYQTFLGNANSFSSDLDRYMNVTKEDVMRVYEQYIKGKHSVVLSVYPEGKSGIVAAEDNYTPKLPDPADADNSEYEGLVYNRPVDDSTKIDRSKQPEAGIAPMVKVPPFWTKKLDNGLKMIGTVNDEIPVTSIQLSVDCGHLQETKENAGVANLLAAIMNESTESYSSEEIAEKLEILGSSIDIHSGKEDITVYISSLTKNLDATMAIANEMIFKPAFDENDFERVHRQHVAGVQNMSTSAKTIANVAMNKMLYGEDNIMSIPNEGNMKSVSSITLDDVKAYYETNFSPSIARLVVVGDLGEKEIIEKLNTFTSWQAKDVKKATFGSVNEYNKTKVVLIHQEGAAQSEIRIAKMAMPYDTHGDFYKTKLMNYPLAGNFNSKVNLYIREEKNWSYGTAARLTGNSNPGPYYFYGGILKNATDSAVQTYIDFIRDYKANGMTAEDLSFTKNAISQSEALEYETGRQKAHFISKILKYDLGSDFLEQQSKVLKNSSIEDLNAIAKEFLNLDEMVILVVGDKNVMGDKVKAIAETEGFDFEEMTIDEVLN